MPGISCPPGVNGATPIGVQLVAGRFCEDLLLDAAEVMAARCGRLTPIDPKIRPRRPGACDMPRC